MNNTRRIFKTATTSQNDIKELLQFIFSGELLVNSEELWIVSPWISDIVIIDNLSGLFSSLNPSCGCREVRFSEIISQILTMGSKIFIVTRPGESRFFLNSLELHLDALGIKENLKIILRETLHIKGILTDTCLLTGSMNFTYYGLEINDEQVTFETSPDSIAEARIEFNSYKG